MPLKLFIMRRALRVAATAGSLANAHRSQNTFGFDFRLPEAPLDELRPLLPNLSVLHNSAPRRDTATPLASGQRPFSRSSAETFSVALASASAAASSRARFVADSISPSFA